MRNIGGIFEGNRKESMKYLRKRFCIFTILVMVVTSCLACGKSDEVKKEEIFDFVENNSEMLCRKIEESQMDKDKLGKIEGVENIYNITKKTITFECGAEGMVNCSTQYGFYYTIDKKASGAGTYWTSGVELSEDGNGYSWSEGDNYYYTERICDYFYYYIARN